MRPRLALASLVLGLLTGVCSAADDAVCVRVRAVWTGGVLRFAPQASSGEAVLYVKNGKLQAIFPASELETPNRIQVWGAPNTDQRTLSLPPGVPILDRRDLIAMPGLVLAQLEVGSGRRDEGTVGARFRALDAYDPFGPYRDLVSKGITSAFLHPGRGRLATGEGAVVKLGGDARLLRARAEVCFELGAGALGPPLKIELPIPSSSDVPIEPGERQRPSSRVALIAEFESRLRAALAYASGRETLRGDARPEFDADLAALASAVLDGRLRVDARRAHELRATLRLANSLKLKPVISGATEAYQSLGALKALGLPLIYELETGLRGPAANYGQNLDRARPRADTPSRLARAGIPFALAPPRGGQANLRLLAGAAVRGGLSPTDALEAITIRAAEVLGVADRVGSLAPGKDADFILVSGDPLASSTEVVETWIDGRRIYRAPRSESMLIRAGTILTSAGPPILDGELLIRDGVIAAVGSSVPHPRGATVIDAGPDGVVTPGFIDAFGHLGYEGPSKAPTKASVPIHRSVATAGPAFLRAARGGITTVVSAPPPVTSRAGTRWADRGGSRLTALKTSESKDPGDDLRRGLVLRETVGMVFDLTGEDPLTFSGLLKAKLGAGKKYADSWAKYKAELKLWTATAAKKKAEASKARATRSWSDGKDTDKPDDAKGGDPKAGDAKTPKPDPDAKPEPAAPETTDPVSGTWAFTISGGPLPAPQSGTLKIKLEEDGRSIVGVVTQEGRPGELPVTGALDGTTVSLTLEAPTPFGPPKVQAELIEEDALRGSVAIGPLSLSFEARRTARVVPEIKVKLKRRSKKGLPMPPPLDLALEPLRAVFEGRGVIAARVDHPAMALTLVRELKARKLPLVFVDFDDADLVAKALIEGGAGVLLRPEETREAGGRTHSLAADLAAAGVAQGYTSLAEDGAAELPLRAAVGVQAGVSQGRALAALTIDAARLFSLDDRVGSLEPGKDGDVLVWDGPPFELTSRLRAVVVGGRRVPEEVE